MYYKQLDSLVFTDGESIAKARLASMTDMWFSSDLHLGHKFVASMRGFDDPDEHDEVILSNFENTIGPDDVLWILGDLSSGAHRAEERALSLMAERLGGVVKHLVPGNHDSCHPMYRHAYKRQRRFLEVFDSVQAFQRMKWDDEDVYLSHFPRPGQDHPGMESRFDDLRLRVPLLVHGHLHSQFPMTGPGQVDVGVEAWGLKPAPRELVQLKLWESLSEKI
ncbi:metallophosphoesterase [Corynebacterium glutamicum]|uniref:metallophosphoesterase n=1 Tax=Corynebacterium glutamicum TaxID=1718 RepID=UPI000941E3BA|nr:metallophosphoesterase [Corynebacterium glutamicum]